MYGVTAVMRAEFLHFEPTRRKFLVFCRRIITTLTRCTGQCNNISHDFNLSKKIAEKMVSDFTNSPPHQLRCRPYLITSVTRPAPTVRPPSRIAKRMCCSIAIGVINITSIATLSPGITISTPSGRVISPVTSVVRK